MKTSKWIVLFCYIFCIPFYSYSAVNIIRPDIMQLGIILDDKNFNADFLIKSLKKELNAILPGQVVISDQFVLSSQWNYKKAKTHYDLLVNHHDVNLIIAFGVLSSSVMIEHENFPKPAMAVGIVEPDVQGLKLQQDNKSNIKNFTYILFNQSLKRDLNLFHDVFPYKNIGIIADKNIINAVVKNSDPIHQIMNKKDAAFTIIALENGINEALKRSNEFDAAFVGYLGRFEGEPKKRLISGLQQKNIPAFGSSFNDISLGALATNSLEKSHIKIVRRIALNIESLLNGSNFSSLPLNLNFEEKLTINIQAAKKIGFSPKFSILTRADVVNEFSDSNVRPISLRQVISLTLENNIDLQISQSDITLAQHDLSLSKSGYFPALSLNSTQTIIDKKRAANSMGQQAQRTTSGNLKLEQVVYSDGLNTSVDIDKKLLIAKLESYQSLHLDTILDAVTAYFNVLKAKTEAKIKKSELKLTKKHLTIAKQRQTAGYSGASEVYQWQSSIATARFLFFQAMNSYRLSKITLNKLMHRPLDDEIMLIDESLNGELFHSYFKNSEYEYIDNPATFKKFTDFLVSRALKNSPEIKELQANMSAFDRQYLNYKYKRYLPTAALTGDASHIFSRDGTGSDVSGIHVEDDQWTIAMNLSWPIFSGGSIRINKIKTKKEINKLKARTDNLVQNLELNVRKAAWNIANKYINLETSETSTKFAEKSLDLVQDSYANGKISITELINAQNDALDSKLNALTASYDYLLSVFNLERTTGRYRIFSTDQERVEYLNNMKSYMNLK